MMLGVKQVQNMSSQSATVLCKPCVECAFDSEERPKRASRQLSSASKISQPGESREPVQHLSGAALRHQAARHLCYHTFNSPIPGITDFAKMVGTDDEG